MIARRRVAAALLAAFCLLLAGCAGVPASGTVHFARPQLAGGVVGEPVTRILPPGPAAGAPAQDIALGFVNALASSDGSYAVARQFLTTAAAHAWHPGASAVVYADNSLSVTVHRSTAVVTGIRIGTLATGGAFELDEGPFRMLLPLRVERGQWRIASAPGTLALSEGVVQRTFLPIDLYFVDPGGAVLVPDRVYVHATTTDLASNLVRRLLAGPSPWLAPAVRSDFPPGTRLVAPVTVSNGVATVALSRQAARASPAQREGLSAQLVWTVKQLSAVSGVSILAGGVPLSVTGEGAVQSTADWSTFNPGVLGPDATVYYSAGGLVQTIDPVTGRHTAVPGTAGLTLRDPAVGGGRIAALGEVDGQTALFTGTLHGPVRGIARAAAMTPPAYDALGRLWTVTTGRSGAQRVLVVGPSMAAVPVGGRALLAAGPVDALVPSRDGTRVAAVVGAAGHRRLLVGRVVAAGGGGLTLGAFHPVLPPQYVDVAAVSWVDGWHLVALVVTPSSGGQTSFFPLVVGVDGWPAATSTVLTAGLPAGPLTGLAAAPGGHQLLVTVGGQVWASDTGAWQPLAAGQDPTFGP